MAQKSYYEQLCQKKTKLYPNGIKNGLMVKLAREADKQEAAKRLKLLKEAGLR